ncbi:MAG: hypothetical protein QOH78_1467 [Verrucomicrobiota bacterium]|jgi:hypothetical protein
MRPRRRPHRRDSACLNASSNPTNRPRPRRRSRSRSLNTAGHRRAPETENENDHDDEGRLRNPLTPTHECLALH